jgi:uncharacterized GH25 family protein
MRRTLVGGIVALVVALLLVWFFWLRDRGDDKKPESAGSARSAKVEKPKTPDKQSEAPKDAPRGNLPKWALDLDKEGPLTLEGQVIGPDGKGVAKAEVWLSSVPPRTATTEDDGTFQFEKLVGRTYALSAKSGDLIGGPIQYKLSDKSDPAVLHLAEAAAVQVTVLDEAKKPIANVEVSSGFTVEAKQKTDAKGEALLKPVSPGYAMVEATAEGYAPGSGFTTVGSAGSVAKLTITLHEGYAIAGRVIDESGRPIAKVRVAVAGGQRFDWTAIAQDGEKNASSSTTDDQGRFRIAAVAAGTHVLYASDGDHAPARSAPVTVDERPVTGVEITMKEGGVLSGTVVDATDKPVPFATVRIAGAGEMMAQVAARQATTDDKGTFEIRGITRAKMQARAESETAASKLFDFDLTDKPEQTNVKLVLDVTGTISGIVIDDKGAPVSEIQVNAFPDVLGGASVDGLALAGMSSATTDGDGQFKITGLPDGAYRLWAMRPGAGSWGWGGRENTPAKTGDKNVKITLSSPGTIKGSIAIAGVGTPRIASAAIGWQAPTPAQDGKFEIKELDPGTYDVTLRGPEFAVFTKRDVVVEAGKTVDLGTITVARGRKIAGRVVDKAGRGVAGATVKVGELIVFSDDAAKKSDDTDDDDNDIDAISGMKTATSDGDGRFTIVGLTSKATTIAADHQTAGRSASVGIPEGAGDPPQITLTLRGFGSISGKVTQQGKPLSGVQVTHSSKSGGAQLSAAQTDDQGNFTLKKVPEGTVTLQAMQQKMMSLKSTAVSVQVTAGKETRANIDIPVGQIKLVVHITPKSGATLNAAQVFLFTGTIVPANGKQLLDAFIGGGAQGMKFWFGADKPDPDFDQLVAGDYSVCSVPITGNMSDPQFMMRIQENAQALKVYCKQTKITASPLTQIVPQELPAMEPLPAPSSN